VDLKQWPHADSGRANLRGQLGAFCEGRGPAIRAVFVGAFSSLDKGFLRLDANGLQIDLL